MPVVGDPAVSDFHEIGGDESDRLTLALCLAEPAGEMAGELHMNGNVMAGDNHLFHRDRQVGHRGAELARWERGPFWPLWASRRQGMVGKGRRDRPLQIRFVAGVPEIVESLG